MKFFFGEKKSVILYINLFSPIHWSLHRKQRCRNFCLRIFGNFARIFDKSQLLPPQFLKHSATLTLEKAYKEAKYPSFPAEYTIHFRCITLWLDNLLVNNNLKTSCLLHLWEIHCSNLTYLGFSRLENLAELLKDVWVKTQDPQNFW